MSAEFGFTLRALRGITTRRVVQATQKLRLKRLDFRHKGPIYRNPQGLCGLQNRQHIQAIHAAESNQPLRVEHLEQLPNINIVRVYIRRILASEIRAGEVRQFLRLAPSSGFRPSQWPEPPTR